MKKKKQHTNARENLTFRLSDEERLAEKSEEE